MVDEINKFSGFVKIHRSILNWEWYSDIPTFRLFVHLLLTVNHKDEAWQGVVIRRGQRVTSYSKLAEETGHTISTIRNTLNKLKTTGEITYETTAKYGIVTIKNYDKFQARAGKRTGEQHTKEQANSTQSSNNRRSKEVIPTVLQEKKKGAAPKISPAADYEGVAWEDLPQEERARRLRR